MAEKIVDNGKCPCCGSGLIEGGFVEICGMEAVQGMSCTGCGASWEEAYVFQCRRNVDGATTTKRKEG